MDGPLSGIRVLELWTLIAAPFAARLFAEFSAEVIKVEQPGCGDPSTRPALYVIGALCIFCGILQAVLRRQLKHSDAQTAKV